MQNNSERDFVSKYSLYIWAESCQYDTSATLLYWLIYINMLMHRSSTRYQSHCGKTQKILTGYCVFLVEIDRYISLADIWFSSIYWYWPKWPILSASVGVDKTLIYSSCIQTTCGRKHNQVKTVILQQC